MAAAESADLCLALGTSLRGTTPDTVNAPALIFEMCPYFFGLELSGCYTAC